MRCQSKLLLAFLTFPILLSFLSLVEAHTITVPTTVKFGKNPSDGSYISFSTEMTFDTIYRESNSSFLNFWFFNGSGIYTTNANMTITKFFVNSWFNYTVNKIGTQKIWRGSKPTSVYINGILKSEGDGWSYSGGTTTITSATSSASLYWGGADTTPPTYSNIAHNTTITGKPCLFSCKWTDETGLSGYKFSWNGTGSWEEDTWTSLSGNPAWANKTKTLPSAGTKVGYKWVCNDTSDNWASTIVYSFTTTAVGESIVVLLNTPSDNATLKSKSVDFTYIPIFYQTIQNASVWINVSATWQPVAWNTTTIQNNTVNTITYNFTNSEHYIWNIAGYNTSQAVFAQQNRTLTMSLEPEYDTIGCTSTEAGKQSTLYCHFTDEDGLSGFIFSWNASGIMQNETWTGFSGNTTEAWAEVTKTLPSNTSWTISYQFFGNDTDNKWVASSVESFKITEEGWWASLSSNFYNAILWASLSVFVGFACLVIAGLSGHLDSKFAVVILILIPAMLFLTLYAFNLVETQI